MAYSLSHHWNKSFFLLRCVARKRGRVVDCTCLENRSLLTGTVSSNLTASAHTQKQPMRAVFISGAPARKFDPYRVSTPIGYFVSLRSQSSSIGLRFLTQSLPDFAAGAQTKTTPKRVFILFVLPPGIEPESQVPQTCILSIKLREQILNCAVLSALVIYWRAGLRTSPALQALSTHWLFCFGICLTN